MIQTLTSPRRTACACALLLLGLLPAAADDAEPDIVDTLRAEAERLGPWVGSDLARGFLRAVDRLPSPRARTLFRDPETRRYFTPRQAAGHEDLQEVKLDAGAYYTTKYGSPLAYVRPLDLLAASGLGSLEGKRVVDFGYGTVGHLRLLASMGAHVTGVDVDSYLTALYSEPGDQGPWPNPGRPDGNVKLVDGRWPASRSVRRAVGKKIDVFLSKNTLKRGYIHPAREVDPRRLVHLGVDDEEFVRRLHAALNPGGLALIYNLSPRQNPPDEPYLPWADGRCPFERGLLESTGFEVIFYDRDDAAAAREMAGHLGWADGGMDVENDLFAHATLLRKPR